MARCDATAYRRLWETRLGWSDEDEVHLDRWVAGRKLSPGPATLESADPAGVDSALPLPREALAFDSKIRIAGLEATSPGDYRDRLNLLLNPLDAARLVDVVLHFRPRFALWWRASGETQQTEARQGARTLERTGLEKLIARVARFYEAEVAPGRVVNVHLIARPPGESTLTVGEQIEDHVLVELPVDQPLEECLDVVSHEVFHCFFAWAPASRHRQLIADFARVDDALALHAYNLLDEALASALATGLVRRLLHPAGFDAYAATPGSFYADTEVDLAARALLPWAQVRLDLNSSLFAGPAEEIVRRIDQAVGPSLARPAIGLRCHLVAYHDQDLAAVRDHLMIEARARASYAFSSLEDENACHMLERHAELGGVLLLRPEDVPRLERWGRVVYGIACVPSVNRAHGHGLLYGVRRSGKAYVYLVIASGATESRRLVDVLLGAVRPFEGAAANADLVVGGTPAMFPTRRRERGDS